ncbi:MAG: transcriptional regulator [Sulfitobacter sp.]|nr:transcriptional regulator [Sulfitobacter sp.]
MDIKHHIQDDTLLAYAAGNLPEAFNLIVAAHVSLCDECRAVVESYDSLGGAIMDNTETATLSADSLAQTLARLDTVTRAPRSAPRSGTLPAPIQDYIGGDLDAVRWRPVGMGVKQAILSTSDDASARLLMIPAGVAIPDHSHEGTEMTLVLKGAFQDEDDRFARGDIEVADGSVSHTPVADIGEDCICLAVTEAPLKFKGFLPKVVQKLVRI